MEVQIRKLTVSDSAAFQSIRLQALKEHPEAYGSSLEEEQEKSLEDIARMFGTKDPEVDFIAGAFSNRTLIGTVGFYQQTKLKVRHKGVIWGVYVQPEALGNGIATRMLQFVIAEASNVKGIEQIQLSVANHNTAAKRLYDKTGFVVFGLEKGAFKLHDQYVDEEHRVLYLK
jgi:ribosomal protein S18 acetylase RimI-like enzyme